MKLPFEIQDLILHLHFSQRWSVSFHQFFSCKQKKKKKGELQEGRKQDINLVQGGSWLWPHQQSFTLLCDLQICLACSVLVEDMSEGITVCCHCLWTSWENIIQKLLKPKPSACTAVCLRLRDWNTEAGQKRVEEPGLVVFYTIFPVLNCFQHC